MGDSPEEQANAPKAPGRARPKLEQLKFERERREWEYLESLSSPNVQQTKRRDSLRRTYLSESELKAVELEAARRASESQAELREAQRTPVVVVAAKKGIEFVWFVFSAFLLLIFLGTAVIFVVDIVPGMFEDDRRRGGSWNFNCGNDCQIDGDFGEPDGGIYVP